MVLDRLAEMNVGLVTFGGGEPMLRQDILRAAIPYALSLGIYPVLLTNGRLVVESERARDTLRFLHDAGLENLSVSLDSVAAAQGRLWPADEGTADGAITKSYYGKLALEWAMSVGFTDLNITAVMNDTDPEPALDVVETFGDTYDVRVSLIQRKTGSDDIFQCAEATGLTFQQRRTLNAVSRQLLSRQGAGVKNTRAYFQGILDGRYTDWSCWRPGYVIVGPTGDVQLCQNIYGSALPRGLNLVTTDLRGETLLHRYDELWKQDLHTHCPGCYINCNVDFHYRNEDAHVHHQ